MSDNSIERGAAQGVTDEMVERADHIAQEVYRKNPYAKMPEVLRAVIEAEGARDIPSTDEVVQYVMRYGGRCRDCADEMGVCRGSGLPCEVKDARRAIGHVISALNYGLSHGYLATDHEAALNAFSESQASLMKAKTDENERLREGLEKADKALAPLADAVFNDNGDLTVERPVPDYEQCVAAYFASRRARALLSEN